MDSKQLNDLRRRAEAILGKRKKNDIPDRDVYKLVEELNLYQVELEVQNEDLIKTQIDLEASHNRYADLYNLAPMAYFTLNFAGLIVDVNQAGLDLLGLKKRMLINRCFSRFVVPESQAVFSQFRLMVQREETQRSCELKLLRWSGPSFDAQLASGTIQHSSTSEKQILICITDISKRIEMEKFLHLQQARMASIERIRSMNEQVHSIAHSQNHSLAIIDNYIYGCIKRLESENFKKEDLYLALKKSSHQTRVLSGIISQMKNISSRATLRFERANLDMMINETLALIHYESGEYPVAVHYEAVEGMPAVKLDKLHVQQVILCLARNAIEAMRDEGIKDPRLMIEIRRMENHSVEFSIIDNGPGFSPQIAPKIFDAHFTTKPYALGLGLSISRTIAEKHSGTLTAQLNSSGGAHFQMVLPCVAVANC